MKRTALAILVVSVTFALCRAPEPRGIFNEPLPDVLSKMEKDYDVRFAYDQRVIGGLRVYAPEGFSPDFKKTLDDVVKPLGLIYHQQGDDWVITEFETAHKRSVAEGGAILDSLATLYSDSAAFSRVKHELRACMFRALGINPALEGAALSTLMGPETPMDGYTVQNIAFESFPGYYVAGTLYKPAGGKGPFAVILCPHGHFYSEKDKSVAQDSGRYAPDMQIRCAMLARMGAVVLNYDMYSWGESVLQSGSQTFHYTPFSESIQTWNSLRCLDFLLSLPQADKSRVGVTGASGGGTQTILVSALDDRVTASAPVVMVSSSFDGGCECESGMPAHSCGTFENNNVQIAAMSAPDPQLVVSEDADWTRSFPTTDFPYLRRIYGFYGMSGFVSNVHLHDSHHDYGRTKRIPVYHFFARSLRLDLAKVEGKNGEIEEKGITIQSPASMHAFNGGLPEDALRSHRAIVQEFERFFNLPPNFFQAADQALYR